MLPDTAAHLAAAVLGVARAADDTGAGVLGGPDWALPEQRGFGEEPHLSLVHTEELIVAAGRCGPIGVDTESVTRQVSYDLLRMQVCTPEEAEVLDALPEAERTARFLRLWTLKEAYTKALGQGMRRSFSAVGFCWDFGGRPALAKNSASARARSFATNLVQDRYLVSEAHCRVEAEPRVLSAPDELADPGPPRGASTGVSGAGTLHRTMRAGRSAAAGGGFRKGFSSGARAFVERGVRRCPRRWRRGHGRFGSRGARTTRRAGPGHRRAPCWNHGPDGL
ncbi:4'-phosphopantetheinyl transferase family protein [Streptomyces sp. NPDC048612]|uniref:4'-phosphopantetheinyl transferase family protein n=1 Tax=Streptomyces sp. NPDC048612 TaxID=3365579 RepID=UPI00371A27A7